jgi:MFS family permease
MQDKLKHDAYAALKVRDFRLFLAFRVFMTMAIQMQSVIVGWQVYELTKDPLALGLAGLFEAIPFISVALYSGYVADRFNRKRVILSFELLFLLGTTGLLIFTFYLKTAFALFGILPIYLVGALSGVARAFIYPSTFALMSQVVPRHLYSNSSTWNSTTWHSAAIAGPAIGGLVYGFFGGKITYMVIIGFVLISVSLLSLIKRYHSPPVHDEESVIQRVSSGIRFVAKNQVLMGSMLLDMLAVLFGGAVSVLPIFAAEILNTGPVGLGFLRASPMVGAVFTSILLAFHPPRERAGRTLLLAVVGFGVSMILFALSRNFFLSMGFLIISGMFDNVGVVIRTTAMQLLTPDEMRGRVASVNSIFVGSSNEIGSFESGAAAKLMGLVPSVIFGGGMTLLVTGIIAKKNKLLRKFNLGKASEVAIPVEENT